MRILSAIGSFAVFFFIIHIQNFSHLHLWMDLCIMNIRVVHWIVEILEVDRRFSEIWIVPEFIYVV